MPLSARCAVSHSAARLGCSLALTAVANAPGARRSRFVPKDRALAELKQAEGASEIGPVIDWQPVPHQR